MFNIRLRIISGEALALVIVWKDAMTLIPLRRIPMTRSDVRNGREIIGVHHTTSVMLITIHGPGTMMCPDTRNVTITIRRIHMTLSVHAPHHARSRSIVTMTQHHIARGMIATSGVPHHLSLLSLDLVEATATATRDHNDSKMPPSVWCMAMCKSRLNPRDLEAETPPKVLPKN
jgi:hypothetical protein